MSLIRQRKHVIFLAQRPSPLGIPKTQIQTIHQKINDFREYSCIGGGWHSPSVFFQLENCHEALGVAMEGLGRTFILCLCATSGCISKNVLSLTGQVNV